MNERTIGAIICISSIITVLLYTWLLFLSPSDWKILDKQLSWWALAVPVYILVLVFWGILIWIGWAMATTKTPPPPLPEGEKEKERLSSSS